MNWCIFLYAHLYVHVRSVDWCIVFILLQALDKANELISGLGETKVLVEVFEAAGHSKVRAIDTCVL